MPASLWSFKGMDAMQNVASSLTENNFTVLVQDRARRSIEIQNPNIFLHYKYRTRHGIQDGPMIVRTE